MQPSVGRELFAAGFASCWAQMNESSQEQLVRNLKTAFSSQNIPPEILATLLNLVCRCFIFVFGILFTILLTYPSIHTYTMTGNLIRQSSWSMMRNLFQLIPGCLVPLLKRLLPSLRL